MLEYNYCLTKLRQGKNYITWKPKKMTTSTKKEEAIDLISIARIIINSSTATNSEKLELAILNMQKNLNSTDEIFTSSFTDLSLEFHAFDELLDDEFSGARETLA